MSLLWLWLRLHAALPVHVEEVEVATPSGRLAGRRLRHDYDLRDGGVTDVVDQFLGVPYAQPPVGELRFQVRLRHTAVCSSSLASRFQYPLSVYGVVA